MGLDFSKPAMTTVTATAGQTDKNEIADRCCGTV